MYNAPINDIMTVFRYTLDMSALKAFKSGDVDIDMTHAILEEAGRLARDVLAPLNRSGDLQGSKLDDGAVTTPDGFKDAYNTYRENGWNTIPFSAEYGGQDLPWPIAFSVLEMWQASNTSFSLCPMLNTGAVDALIHHGSEELKSVYLEKLISGEWTGTMNLTEPQAGSDLSKIKTVAVSQDDGSYKITGQKIFITYGEHDFTENIVHLVLARLPDAPEGTKGISLFLVPKFFVNENGSLGERNDVKCVGLEHKLGIHASPTCTMQFGDQGGATGYLVGDLHRGLFCMFTMMNNARLSVGLQGVALADGAYQKALAYAKERVQGGAEIINHPDVDRMLRTMRVLTLSGRMMAYSAMYNVDLALGGDKEAGAAVDVLTPIVKSWCTDRAVETTSLGVQVHGGMGFIEETGAAQYYRDVRILPIYEGTNGIQAMDLQGRKLLRDQGEGVKALLGTLSEDVATFSDEQAKSKYKEALEDLSQATDLFLQTEMADGLVYNTYYLEMFGYILAGYYLEYTLQAMASGNADQAAQDSFRDDALFYRQHILARYVSCHEVIKNGLQTEYVEAIRSSAG